MKIRTQFIITTFTFAFILLAIVAGLIITNRQIQQMSQQEDIAINLEQEANELGYLSSDYLIYQENQQLSRWEAKFASFSVGLASLKPGTLEQQELTSNLQTNQRQLQAVFTEVKAAVDKTSQNQGAVLDPAFIQVAWGRMEVQNQGLIFNTSHLSQLLSNQKDQLKQNFNLLIIILVGFFGVFVLGNYFLNDRRTIKSISLLQSGTKIIGSGNLDYTIPAKGKDEISDLSRAFNQMSANLKTVTASKSDLEKEIFVRKTVEEALKSSQQDLNRAQQVAHVGSWRLDIRKNELVWSDEAYRIFGIPQRTPLTYDIFLSRVHPEDRECVDQKWQTALKGGESYNLEYRIVAGDELKWVHADGEVEISEDGSPKGGFGIVQDITSLKQNEEELKRRALELEAANKELEAFNYSVSHDLRQPLRALDGFSLAIMNDIGDRLDETNKDYLCRVRKASQNMGQLIDGLLKLSRVTRTEMSYNRVNLSDLAGFIAEDLKKIQPERQVEFVITPDLTVGGDKQLLNIALRNILENAWKFCSKRPQTRIEMGIIQQNAENVYFIRDNGAGFEMKYYDKLFQPFQRLHSAEDYEGTGIGLATVQRIILRHGGRVWAESELGKGTTIYFTLEKG